MGTLNATRAVTQRAARKLVQFDRRMRMSPSARPVTRTNCPSADLQKRTHSPGANSVEQTRWRAKSTAAKEGQRVKQTAVTGACSSRSRKWLTRGHMTRNVRQSLGLPAGGVNERTYGWPCVVHPQETLQPSLRPRCRSRPSPDRSRRPRPSSAGGFLRSPVCAASSPTAPRPSAPSRRSFVPRSSDCCALRQA